jgi:hypothetical protein
LGIVMSTSAGEWAQGTTEILEAMAALPARRRRIDRESGRALEILGHAIEYLADENALAGNTMLAGGATVTAIELLMAANRKIYLECPVVPSLGERCRAFVQAFAPQLHRS